MLLATRNSFHMLSDLNAHFPAVDTQSTSSHERLKYISDEEQQPPRYVSRQFDTLPVRYQHPLEHTWTMWYLENDRNKNWEEMQNEITSFDMVEDFWSLYGHIKTPSELRVGSDYSLFKKGIQPMWEDDANKYGGRWVINIGRCFNHEIDKIWLDVMLILIGEAVQNADEICGAVINMRSKTNKISIWTANGEHELAILEIGQKLRNLLGMPPNNLHYQLHRDTMSKQGSIVKAAFIL